MPAFEDLTGQRFGRLVVIKSTDQRQNGFVVWSCRCDCGKKTKAPSRDLKTRHKQSCGCLRIESNRARFTTHGGSRTLLYHLWYGMKHRCGYKKHPLWHRYGERGIKVCLEWQTFEPFHRWATDNGYQPGLTIDRIDNDRGYEPANCEWITRSENGRRGALARRG